MRIKSVQATWLHVPIPEKQQHVSDFGKVSSFDCTLVPLPTANTTVVELVMLQRDDATADASGLPTKATQV